MTSEKALGPFLSSFLAAAAFAAAAADVDAVFLVSFDVAHPATKNIARAIDR